MRTKLNLSHLTLLLLSFLFSSTIATSSHLLANDDAPAALRYTLDFSDAQSHYVNVGLTIETGGEESIELLMAAWTPGSYLIREYSRNITEIEAVGDEGEQLPLVKTTKNRWTVDCAGHDSFEVNYRIYARELSVRTNFVEEDFAVLNGAATFITVVGREQGEHDVEVQLRSNWSRAISALEQPDGFDSNRFLATDFDQLVDSPILVGNPQVYPFTVGGYEHWLVNLGDDTLWNGAQAARDMGKIVAEHQGMWGTIPYERYLFLNVLAESGGGLEHDSSTLLLSSRWTFRSRGRYNRWLSTVSHEYFHTWNIRTMRPKALVDYDYENENYFPSLWIAEGITSYYDDLALVRSGIIEKRDYLSGLSGTISGVQGTPGRQVQSLRDASHDAWIKYYRPDENSRNTTISYYTKGALVGFLLDAKIRRETENAKSLDDVMRICYQRFSDGVGFDESEFREVASEVAGVDLSEWFASAVDSTDELVYEEALDWYGLAFRGRSAGQSTPTRSGTPWTGWSTSSQDGRLVVTGIERNSPAATAGINVDDELLAINDFRVSSSRIADILDLSGVGEEVEVLVARRGVLRRISLTPTARENQSYSLTELREPSDEQRENLNAWLAGHAAEAESEPSDASEATADDSASSE